MTVILVAGIAGVAVASGSLGTSSLSKGPVRPGAGDPSPSQGQVGVAGPADAQTLTEATPSLSPTPMTPRPLASASVAPRSVPAKSTVVPLPGGAPPAGASNLGDAQFHNVAFSCPPSPYSLGPGQTVVNCTVASLGGFSGQITTQCSSAGLYSCSAPPVDLVGGGSAVIPLTITPLPTAPQYGAGATFSLTLASGAVTLNPGRPYSISGQGPPQPANFTLACRMVTQTALPWPMISVIVGSCTVTALDAADIATTSVHIRGIKPPVPGNQDLHLQLCMAPTQAAAIQSYRSPGGSNANVIPTGGTGTVWFGYNMSPLGSTGGMPGPWEFDFAADQGGGPQVTGAATFTLQPDGTVANL